MRQRSPIFPPWSKSECPLCADPVEHVVMDLHDPPGTLKAIIIRAVYPKGTIAVRWIGDQLHGYRITEFHPLQDGFVAVREHAEVCAEAVPPTEQRPLF